MLERYGTAVELDLAFHTSYRLTMFWSGEEALTTLVNLVGAFEQRTTSYLQAAMGTDTELYEQTMDNTPRKAYPPWVEETTEVGLLKGISEQLQVIAQLLPAKKKPKVKPYPRPRTARQIWQSEQARREYQEIQAAIRYIPDEEYLASIQQAAQQTLQEEGGD